MRRSLQLVVVAGMLLSAGALRAQVPNDTCDTAEVVTDGTTVWGNDGATASGINPGCGGVTNPLDVWFEYTATCDGVVVVDTEGTPTGDTRLAIWDGSAGCPVAGATPLDCDDDGGTGLLSAVSTPVITGAVYYIQAAGFSGGTVPTGALLNIACLGAPANDTCDTAEPIDVGVPVAFNTVTATNEGVAASCMYTGAGTGVADMWYSVTVANDGTFRASTCAGGGDTQLGVWGADCATEIACSDDLCGAASEVTWDALAGETYNIQVSGWGDTGTVSSELLVTEIIPALNDTCDTALPIDIAVPVAFDTSLANNEGNAASCFFGAAGGVIDVWFQVTPVNDGPHRASTCAGGGDTQIGVWLADCTTEIACSDDDCGFSTEVDFDAIAGETYNIQVSGWGSTATVASELVVWEVAFIPPANDSCLTAQTLTSTATFSTLAATDSGVTSACAGGADVWFAYSVQCDGDVTFDTCGSSFDTVIAVWSGSCPNPGDPELDCNDDSTALCAGTGASELTVSALAGETYFIQVTGAAGATGAGVINVTSGGAPANDTCDTAEVITDGSYSWTNACATASGDNPGCGGFTNPIDVWYEYTATCDGIMTVDTEGTPSGDTRLAVWDGCPSAGGAVLDCDDDGGTGLLSLIELVVTSGTTYYIQAAGFSGGTVPAGAQLNVSCGAAPVQSLTCTAAPSGDVTLTWVNPSLYDSIEVDLDAVLDQTLPGDATTAIVSASGGTHTICVRGVIGGVTSGDVCCTVQIPGDFTGQIVILDGEELDTGLVDSVAAVTASFDALGLTNYAVVDSLDVVGGTPASVWALMGTYPDDRELTVAEGDKLRDWVTLDFVPVLVSAGDLWGFTPLDTGWNEIDGVGSPVDDGGDAVEMQIASDFLAADGTTVYVQDAVGSDWIDELHMVTEAARTGGAPREILRPADAAGVPVPPDTGPDFITGIAYTDDNGVTTIALSTEIGGYNGGGPAEVQAFVENLNNALTGGGGGGGGQFIRGDANDDGTFDISDAVFSLSALFVPGSPASTCSDAADANNDNAVDISDAVFTLSALFVPGSPPPDAPHPNCGSDSVDPIGCDAYTHCP